MPKQHGARQGGKGSQPESSKQSTDKSFWAHIEALWDKELVPDRTWLKLFGSLTRRDGAGFHKAGGSA